MHRSNQRAAGWMRLLVPALFAAAALGACTDQQPVAPPEPSKAPPTAPFAAKALQAFECTGSIHGGVSCKAPGGSAGAASGAIIGVQSSYVKLTSTNASYDSVTQIYQFDVTVKNLMKEVLGSPDGVIPDPEGIRVFVDSLQITSGTGSIAVENEDSTAPFPPGNRQVPFFAYHQILAKDQVTPARNWRLSIPKTAYTFRFVLFLETDVQYLLVINEVMANPGANVAYNHGQWFEIYNAGSLAVNLRNLVVADSSTTGRRPYRLIAQSLIVLPDSHATLGIHLDPNSTGGARIDYEYGAAMSYDALKIARVYGTDTLTIDRVALGSAAISRKDGISRELMDPALDNANVDGTNWIDALPYTVYGLGGRGTPKARNQTCVPPTMAVGAAFRLPGGGFCLDGGASGAEYTVIPMNLSSTAAAPLTATLAGIVPVSGAPTPNRIPTAGARALRVPGLASLRAADAFESRLRARERRELNPLIAATRRGLQTKRAGARRSIALGVVPAVNSLMTLNAELTGSCEPAAMRTGKVKAVNSRVIVVADTLNPANGLSDADYGEIAGRFESLVWPTVTTNFGAPYDMDQNGRVVVFFTRAVNELTPAGAAPLAHGFTLRRDLFFSSTCAQSNEGEMIYMAAADPAGAVNGNVRTAASVKYAAARTLGHEMAHLINASRRIYVNFAPAMEEAWLDEGLADVAEELLFYADAGRLPRQNLGHADVTGTAAVQSAFEAFAAPNYARLREWLRAPDENALYQGDGDPATRGATWAFLRFSADRKGGSQAATWYALVNATTTGNVNASAAFSSSNLTYWMHDFTAAMYLDDAVAGASASYSQPSWNFRSLYNWLDYTSDQLADGYPLAPRDPSPGVYTLTLSTGGSVAYLRMGVPADAMGTVSFTHTGPVPLTSLRYVVVRRK